MSLLTTVSALLAADATASPSATTAAAPNAGDAILGNVFPILLIGFVVWMMWNSSRKRKRAAVELKTSLAVGAEVILHSGITGTIIEMDDATAIIESTKGTKLRIVVGAIRGIDSTKAQPAAAAEHDAAEDSIK